MTRSPSMDVSAPLAAKLVLDAPQPELLGAHLYSRFVQRLQRRYGDVLKVLAPGIPSRESLKAAYEALTATGLDTGAALRVLRQITLERLAQLDCTRQAPLDLSLIHI
jgi:glutamate-ammonia-ligase adenylyltransferase